MFTGLIEEIGVVKQIAKGANSYQFTIGARTILSDLKLGDSVATNGACLTVVHFSKSDFTVDIMAETVKRTTFHEIKNGDTVNLERAMRLNDRLGGHMVSGHIDGIGSISKIIKEDIATIIQVETSTEILAQMINKGSIAIDGISLTLMNVTDKDFQLSIIPHTAQQTTLLKKKTGDKVNLETDLIGKYVQKILRQNIQRTNNTAKKTLSLSMDFLAENGFI